MRLIDADELLKEVIPTDDYEIDGDTYWDYVVYEEDIKKAKTVDAIPVEWIEKWLDEFFDTKIEEEITDLDPFKKNVYQGILLMYNDWRRQK